MDKWADYAISAVRFNAKHTHIDRVRAHPDTGSAIGEAIERTRAQIVTAVENGTTYVTIFRDTDGRWKKGQAVYITTINNTKYIKTVDDALAVDNLDNLPEF